MPHVLRRSTVAKDRRPQINFQVHPAMKLLYEEAKACGHGVRRFCASGFRLRREQPQLRRDALNRLREWEEEHAHADANKIRNFVQSAEATLQTAPIKGMRPPSKPRKGK